MMKPGRGLPLPGLLYGIPNNLGRPADALLICVSVHPEGDGLVAVSHGLRHAGNVRAVGDGNAGNPNFK